MNYFAKDLKPDFMFSTGEGWNKIVEISRDRSKAKQALRCQFVCDVTLTYIHIPTQTTIVERCNGHRIFDRVVEV